MSNKIVDLTASPEAAPAVKKPKAFTAPRASMAAKAESSAAAKVEDGQVTNWCGTVFPHKFGGSHRNSMDELIEKLKEFAGETGFALIGHLEQTKPGEDEEVGKDHYHIVLCLEKRKRFKQFLELWSPHLSHIHWERMVKKSTPALAVAYATKEGPAFFTHGTCPDSKGKIIQDRWKETRMHAEAGELDKVDDQHYVTHLKNILMIADRAATKRQKASIDSLTNYWIMGHTGAGKSLYAREGEGRTVANCYAKCVTNYKWWDHYDNEPNVIVEDIDEKFAEPQLLKVWCDHYAFHAETKGSMKKIRPQTFIFTSNVHPHAVYGSLDSAHVQAIDRRIQVLLFYKKNYVFGNGTPFLQWPKGVIPSLDIVAQVLAEQSPDAAVKPKQGLGQFGFTQVPVAKVFFPGTGLDFQNDSEADEEDSDEVSHVSASDDDEPELPPTQPLTPEPVEDIPKIRQPVFEEKTPPSKPLLKRSETQYQTPIPPKKRRTPLPAMDNTE